MASRSSCAPSRTIPTLGQIHVDAMLDKQVDGIIATGKRIDRPLPVDLSHLPVPSSMR